MPPQDDKQLRRTQLPSLGPAIVLPIRRSLMARRDSDIVPPPPPAQGQAPGGYFAALAQSIPDEHVQQVQGEANPFDAMFAAQPQVTPAPAPQANPFDAMFANQGDVAQPQQMAPRPDAVVGTYQTTLDPATEAQFRQWVAANKVPFNPDDTSGKNDYDMRGFYKGLMSGDEHAKQDVSQFDGKMHYSDWWKTPYHKTFSQDSQWAVPDQAPQWVENRLVGRDGTVIADETPQPQMGALGPTGPQGAPPPMITRGSGTPKPKAEPKKEEPKPPSELQKLAAHLLMEGEHHAAGIVHGIQALSENPINDIIKGALTAGQQRAEEAHKHGNFSAGEAAATTAGMIHGGLQLGQDATNAALWANRKIWGLEKGKGQGVHFADDFANWKGFTGKGGPEALRREYPGAFGTASVGGGMALPLGAASKGAKAAGFLKQVAHGAAAGAGFGAVGSIGQQEHESGNVDPKKVAEQAAIGAGMGAAVGGAAHVLTRGGAKGESHQPQEPTPPEPEGSRQTQGHQRKDYTFVSKEVKARLLKQDELAGGGQTEAPKEYGPTPTEESGADVLKLHKKIIGGKEVKLNHWQNEDFKKAQADYAGRKQIIEDMYGDDEVLKRKELAAAAEEHYKNIKAQFGGDTANGAGARAELGAQDEAAGGAKTKAQTDYTQMSDAELEKLGDEHELTLKKAEKGLSLPRGAAIAAERESKAIGAEKFRRAMEAHKATLAAEAAAPEPLKTEAEKPTEAPPAAGQNNSIEDMQGMGSKLGSGIADGMYKGIADAIKQRNGRLPSIEKNTAIGKLIQSEFLDKGIIPTADQIKETWNNGEPLKKTAAPTAEDLYANDLDHQELKKYPNHRDEFNDLERKDDKNILVRQWQPINMPDRHLNQHIEILEAAKKENGKLNKRRQQELDASLQEKARRAERIANGHERNWPEEKPPEEPAYTPPEDYTKLSDEELHSHLGKGTWDHQMAADNEVIRRAMLEPEPENTRVSTGDNSSSEPAKYTFRKVAKGYEILDPDGNVHSRPKEKESAVQARVDKLNSGELAPTKGAKDSYKTSETLGPEQQKIEADAVPPKPEHAIVMDALATAKHGYDEARARYNATYDSWLRSQPPELVKMTTKPAFKYDRAAERQVMNEMPELTGYEVQSSRRITGEYIQSRAKGLRELGEQVINDKKAETDAKKVYDAARKEAIDALEGEEGPIAIPHPKGTITIRRTAKTHTDAAKRLHELTQPEMQEYAERQIGPVKKWLGEVGKWVEDAYRPDGISSATLPGVPQMLSAAKAVAKKYGTKIDTRTAHRLMMNELNSDIYARTANPEFTAARAKLLGKMDLNFQGVDKLTTQEQKNAWQANRYSRPSDILAGKNGANLLDSHQQHALIGQNEILNDLADLHEQYYEHLKDQGYDGEGLKALIPGQNELAATLKTDLANLDRATYGPKGTKGMVDKFGRQVTSGIYDMYVTGNWPIHQLHAIEASSVGLSYHPIAFTKAVTSLASHPATREFVHSFESSSGNMKSIREDSDTVLGKHWRALQAALVGGKANAQALANNKGVQLAGDVLEGSIAEKAKLHLLRAQSAHIAAEEMNYPGGGNKLMEDMNHPQTMNPDKRIEAATKIVYHMNQMIGYSPSGVRDLNIFGRISNANPLVRWFTPFTTTRIQQSRILTKFFTNAAHHVLQGDGIKATASVAQGLTMLGTIAMIGGRAGIPREIQDILHGTDPEVAKNFLEMMDRCNYIGGLFNTEVEHVTPQLFVPAYLGDSFPVQMIKAMDDSVFGKEMGQWRGAATLLAALGIASVADKLGFSTILKLAKAGKEGVEGEYKQYAARMGDTGQTIANAGVQITKTAKNFGMPVDAGYMKGILGAKYIKTSLPERIGQTLRTGLNITAAEFVNRVRDDNAFGDKLNQLDPKLYKKLQAQNSKLSKAYEKAQPEARENIEKMQEGYWERHYKEYIERKRGTQQERLATSTIET